MNKKTLAIFIWVNTFAIILLVILITWKETMPISVYPCRPVDIEMHYNDYYTKQPLTQSMRKLLSESEMIESVNPTMDDNEIMMLYPKIAWFWPRGTCYKLDDTKWEVRQWILFISK